MAILYLFACGSVFNHKLKLSSKRAIKRVSKMPASKITNTLDTTSLVIEDIERYLNLKNTQEHLTDVGARLSVLSSKLEKCSKNCNEQIKAMLLEDNKTIAEGNLYLGVLSKLEVTRLITDKVKKFLGRRLSQFTNTSNELRLNYKIKG